MKYNEHDHPVLDPLMTYITPGAGAAGVTALLLSSSPLSAPAAVAIGIPSGIVAGWIVSILVCSTLSLVTGRV